MKRIGGYEILAELGRGGMGVVYRAREDATGREVAIKLLLESRRDDATQLRRFQREAESLARVRHPGIVTIHSAGEHEGRPYVVLDFVPGESLAGLLRRTGPFDPRRAASLVATLADALEDVHGCGVVHRDVKPENVLMSSDGQPRLTDFGLARDLEAGGAALSKAGVFMGTPGYWPPEQAQGKLAAIGPHSDVYALGGLLFALLTGEAPQEATTLPEAMAKLLVPPVPPSSLRPGVPPELDAIVLRCLAREPKGRYASAAALRDDLAGFLSGEASPRPARWRARSLWLGVAAVGVAAALGALAPRDEQPDPPATTAPAPPVETVEVKDEPQSSLVFTALRLSEAPDPEALAAFEAALLRADAQGEDAALLTEALQALGEGDEPNLEFARALLNLALSPSENLVERWVEVHATKVGQRLEPRHGLLAQALATWSEVPERGMGLQAWRDPAGREVVEALAGLGASRDDTAWRLLIRRGQMQLAERAVMRRKTDLSKMGVSPYASPQTVDLELVAQLEPEGRAADSLRLACWLQGYGATPATSPTRSPTFDLLRALAELERTAGVDHAPQLARVMECLAVERTQPLRHFATEQRYRFLESLLRRVSMAAWEYARRVRGASPAGYRQLFEAITAQGGPTFEEEIDVGLLRISLVLLSANPSEALGLCEQIQARDQSTGKLALGETYLALGDRSRATGLLEAANDGLQSRSLQRLGLSASGHLAALLDPDGFVPRPKSDVIVSLGLFPWHARDLPETVAGGWWPGHGR